MILHPINFHCAKPEKLNNPFYYQPDELCKFAQKEVLKYLETKPDFLPEIEQGKMFGVLIVEDKNQNINWLCAYSGQILGREDHDFFVPAVFDYLDDNGYFKVHEREISALNLRIKNLEESPFLQEIRLKIQENRLSAEQEISQYQNQIKSAKARREMLRQSPDFTEKDNAALIKESQFMKAELKRLKSSLEIRNKEFEQQLTDLESEISELKELRKKKSDSLQNWLFSNFEMLNANGEKRNLIEIFETYNGKIPPAGSGECCAPKLLQYAYLHGLKPLSIAEFWYGKTNKNLLRRHLEFYPACNEKCKPILNFMLHGLSVVNNPLLTPKKLQLEKVFEDEYLAIVNKPDGMLSVPGKNGIESVYSIVRQWFPDAEEPMICHRLDMATSGLMIIAKKRKVYENIQQQFECHEIKKTYFAILNGEISKTEGEINLPLMPDLQDRPRQIVDFKYGKEAVTRFRVLTVKNGKTLIEFQPQTGRTHQLRVHSAHADGLNCPILGDELYGEKSLRMYLHAGKITFQHPVTKEVMTFESHVDWADLLFHIS